VRRGILIFVGILMVLEGFSQVQRTSKAVQPDSARQRILGDTIEATYTALTTKFIYERNIKFNDGEFYHPDTVPDNFHQFTDLERNQNFVQNLGNLGTAFKPLFFEPKSEIGRSTGFQSFDEFHKGPDDIKYYDTRSPYTDITGVFGGNGRALTDIEFAMNDSTRFSIGFGYNNIRADKQMAFLQQGDYNVKSTNWNIFGYLRPEKIKRYNLLFNFTQMRHEVIESGGMIPPEIDPGTGDTTLWNYLDANVILSDAVSLEKRGGLHIFHQFELDSEFQVYHQSDYNQQLNRYNDMYDLGLVDSLIYKPIDGQTVDTIANRSAFIEFKNEFGFKGRTKKFAYSVYYKLRQLSYDNVLLSDKIVETEHFVGGTLRQQITKKLYLRASGELMLEGNYFLRGDVTSPLFDATYNRVQSKPSFISENYSGQQSDWTNSFKNEVSDNISGQLKIRLGSVLIKPNVRFNRIGNHIYYDYEKQVAQADKDVVLLVPGLDFEWEITDHWKWKSTFKYSSVSGEAKDVYRIPEIMVNSQLAFKNILFEGKMIVQTGLDIHYRSSYYAYDYNPVDQQYFLQNTFENESFVRADLFVNFRVQNFILLAKMGHVNQGWTNGGFDGYMLTPYYPGVQRTFDLGLRWAFYD